MEDSPYELKLVNPLNQSDLFVEVKEKNLWPEISKITYLNDNLLSRASNIKMAAKPPTIHFKLRGKKKGAEGSYTPMWIQV